MNRAPRDYSEDELLALIREASGHVPYYVADWERELGRREAERQAKEQARIAQLATGAAIVSAGAALLALVVAIVALVAGAT